MKKHLMLLACVLFAGLSATTHAHVPKKVAYQGYLTNASGQPVSATVDVTFRLYTTASGGTPVWQETQSVAVAGGTYSATLGSQTLLELDFANPYFLGVTVGADAEMTPRQALSSVPYALRALGVEPGAIGTAELADGSVGPAKLANCGLDEILKFTASGWACSADANTSVSPSNSVTSATSFGLASSAGSSAAFARGDHTHGTPAAPALPAPAGSVSAATTFGIASAVGSSAAYARADHTHGTPPTPVIPAAPTFFPIGGQASASIAASSISYVFVGPTVSVTVASTQTRIAGVVTAALGVTSGTASARLSLCSQPSGGGAITDLSGSQWMEVEFGTTRLPYTANVAKTGGLGAGTYSLGLCVQNTGTTAINKTDWVQGWFQVVNP